MSEILITLGIIGVIAAITIPGIITTQKAHRLRTQFLKSYSVLNQAFKLMETDDISTDMRSYTGSTFYKTFANYLSAPTICGNYVDGNSEKKANPAGCYSYRLNGNSDGYKYLTGNSYVGDGTFNNGQLMLQDGTLIFFDDSPIREGWKGVLIFVDINGYVNKPNRLSYDFFCFEVIDGAIHTMGDIGTSYEYTGDATCKNGWTCAHMAKDNPDYFKMVVRKYN